MLTTRNGRSLRNLPVQDQARIDIGPGHPEGRIAGKIMEKDSTDIPKEYLLKLIENEINSGFLFVAIARKAYKAAKLSDGNAALAKAEAVHDQLATLTERSRAAQIRAVTHQLSELRAAIDWILTGFEPANKSSASGMV